MLTSQTRGMIPGAPLPLDQSLLLIWPQITGLIAGMIVLFAMAYIDLPARGSPRLKDWTVTAALNNARWCDAVCPRTAQPGGFSPTSGSMPSRFRASIPTS